ncbi:MAG: phytanoyl-CoA dioxygenase family protein [Planctomycetaceae bacterium]|nr:phytanoyl-CoA dioxygenase family protein [Planctomycetales bacterium]MCB9875528.1 phytanoyl-CoA dioxygenase family protein [Planctomycetaceae bacterium]MCB9939294.1 phytanoyl-CoA dioxygenase family protein [Planctomycetaceae bacterium]
MIPDDAKPRYDRDGFVVVRNFLDRDALQLLEENVNRYIREVVPHLPAGDAFYHDRSKPETLKQLQHMGQDSFFDGYRRDEQWKELAELLIGEHVEAQEPEWFNKPPGTEHPTPPHQDNYYFCLRPANVATLWLALDAVDEENGCLRYVVGSHRHGIRSHAATKVLGFSQGITDHGDDDVRNEQTILLEPGDLVAHHGETIHRADPNRTASRHRRAFAMVFRGISCHRDEAAYARYLNAVQQQHSEFSSKTS